MLSIILSSNNILIDENNDLTLIDFDHSKHKNGSKIEFTANIGSVNTMAPEQSETGESSSKSDIFSIGRIIKFIFETKSSEMKKEISVFKKCIEKSPKSRPNVSQAIFNFFIKIGFNLAICPITDENKEIKTFI